MLIWLYGVLTLVYYQSKTIENVGCIHWLLPGFYARDKSVIPAVIDPSAGSRWKTITDKLTTAARNVSDDMKSQRLGTALDPLRSCDPGIIVCIICSVLCKSSMVFDIR
jgi:hypothetical protein